MEVQVHPADPSKVIVRNDPNDEWTACDNILGEFDEYLSADEVKARQDEPFYLHICDTKGGTG